jgi:drug/metabolite transporter (DMT)-like permease
LVDNPNYSAIWTLAFTVFALIAFAANSVLSRLALGVNSIDASSYTAIRLLSGVIVLMVILQVKNTRNQSSAKGSWFSGILLFLYAITFSYAYITLTTATGALILFGSVQVTMITNAIITGNQLRSTEWVGVFIAFAGFLYLISPGVSTPPLKGLLLMTMAGFAWGTYTLRGRDSASPLADTAYNFLRTMPLVLILILTTSPNAKYSLEGVVYASLSGAVASGIGYTIWYIALGGLSTTQAAVIQLSVPVIAALGGIVLIGEAITLRLAVAALMILGGILMVILGRK